MPTLKNQFYMQKNYIMFELEKYIISLLIKKEKYIQYKK